MKKIFGISIVIAIAMMTACDLSVENEKTTDLEIISIHDLKLKPGVDEKEFETFVMSEIAPLYKQMKGQDFFLGKGYVGQREGQYSIFLTFNTLEDRNNIYPLSGGFSEEFEEITGGKDAMWNKFVSMAEGFDGVIVTDYLTENKISADFDMICIHDLKLKPGVDEKEFETFVMSEIAPLYKQMKGQDFTLGKGYVGLRSGKYSIIITFKSVDDRNRIYPLDIGFSEEFQKAMEGKEAMWNKFRSMVAEGFDGVLVTDYLKVGQ